MALFVAGLILFLGVHLLPAAQPLRARLVARLGDRPYRGVFALVSLAGFALLIVGYGMAQRGPQLFVSSRTAIAAAPYVVTIALVLFAAANMRGHTRRVVRHPMLLGLALWAGIHLAANGDLRGTILFASFLAYAAIDFVSVRQRHAVKTFEPVPRHDAIAVIAGIVVAILIMWVHRPLFGVQVVPWGV